MKKKLLVYSTKEEAEIELHDEVLKGSGSEFLCPLINTRCKSKCICWSVPYVYYEPSFSGWIMRKGRCNNKMFFGQD